MKPNFLNNNMKIALVAPSFGCTTSPYNERLLKAIEIFNRLKINLLIGDNCFKNEGIAASNTPILRAKEFHEAWLSNCDAIISVGGGETMIEILEHIDFELIKNNPAKWFVGFSDNTNLTYTITTNCDIETIYGTNAPNFCRYPFTYDTLDTLLMLQGKKEFKGYGKWQLNEDKSNPFNDYNFDMKTNIIAKNYTKPFEGRLLGGCLDCLVSLCGTKYDKTAQYISNHSDEGIIFFLEACELNSIGIRRALFQLKNAGWFNNIKGFIVGRSLNYNDQSFGTTPIKAYIDLLADLNVPILLDIDLGHLSPSIPIRCGGYAKIEYNDNNIFITYKE